MNEVGRNQGNIFGHVEAKCTRRPVIKQQWVVKQDSRQVEENVVNGETSRVQTVASMSGTNPMVDNENGNSSVMQTVTRKCGNNLMVDEGINNVVVGTNEGKTPPQGLMCNNSFAQLASGEEETSTGEEIMVATEVAKSGAGNKGAAANKKKKKGV